MRRRRSSPNEPVRRGAVLLEALIAGTVLAIGLAALVSISTRALSQQQLGEERIVAATLIDELLNMVVVEGPVDFHRRNDMSGRFAAPFDRFEYQIEITDQGELEPLLVTVTVRWISNGYERQETVQTMIANQRGEKAYMELREPGEPIVR